MPHLTVHSVPARELLAALQSFRGQVCICITVLLYYCITVSLAGLQSFRGQVGQFTTAGTPGNGLKPESSGNRTRETLASSYLEPGKKDTTMHSGFQRKFPFVILAGSYSEISRK